MVPRSHQPQARPGQSLILIVCLSLALLAFLGLVHDAGALFTTRRELQGAADAAARAGADAMKEEHYRALEGLGADAYSFDPLLAASAARGCLAALDDPQHPFSATIDTGGRVVIVTLRREVHTLLLRDTTRSWPVVAATGVAEPQNH